MTMKIIALFLSIVLYSVLSAQSAAIQDANLESDNFGVAIKRYYSALQRIMPCGLAALKIPVMDPYTLPEWNINMKRHGHAIQGALKNIVVTGLQNFDVLESSYDAQSGIMNLDVFHPALEFLAEYNAGKLGNGVLDIKIVEGRSTVQFSIAPNATHLEFSNYKVNLMLGDIKFNNWNNMWSISVNNFVNEIAREIALFAIQEVQPYFNSYMNDKGLPYINNHLLNAVTLNEVVNNLNVLTNEFNSASCQA